MNYPSPTDTTVQTETQVRQQLAALGYGRGDRVEIRLLKPKNMPLDEQLKRELAFKSESGRVIEMPIVGYLTLGEQQLSLTRLTKDKATGERTKAKSLPFKWLQYWNQKGYGVYFVVNPGGESDAEITECRSLFYECDGISKDEQWAKLRSLEALLGKKATLVIETRNSLHCYFALNEPLKPEDFRQYQQRLIQQQDSDPAIFNPARLMRLAGFDHQKWVADTATVEPTPVRIVQVSASTFSVSDFDYLLPAWDEARWGKQKRRDRTNSAEGDNEPFAPSDPTGDPFDIRNFAHIALEQGGSRKAGWKCYKCPVHNGDSNDSLHIDEETGSVKCWSGCDREAIVDAALELAINKGYQIPPGAKRQRKKKAKKLPSYALTYAPDIAIQSRYLGSIDIPEGEKLICLKAPKGCGKTELIARWVEEATRNGQRVWVITYREQLGVQLARRFGLPYKTEVRRSAEGKLLGYVCCIDSLHPRAEVPFSADGTENDLVIIDEAESVTWHTLDSSTCSKQRVSILKQEAALLTGVLAPGSKGQVVLADADLSDLSVDYVRGMGGPQVLKPFVIESLYKPEKGWDVFSYAEPADLLKAMKEAVSGDAANSFDDIIEAESNSTEGGKHLILTTGQKVNSKWGSQTLETKLKKAFPNKRILRIDSLTIADPSHPAFGCLSKDLKTFLAEYDIVICSPTLESGVSIDMYGHFAAVWGFFPGVTPENSVRQFLARLRDNDVPRHVYVAERGINTAFVGNGATDAKALLECENQKAALNRAAIADASTTVDQDGTIAFNAVPLETWGKMGARINLGLENYRASVHTGLEAEGHTIHEGVALEKAERVAISEEMSEIRDENHQRSAEAIPAAELPETEAEYEALKQKKTKTEAERNSERHYELCQRYQVEITAERVLQDDDGWHPLIQLQYFLTVGNAFLPQRDKKRFESIADLEGLAFIPDVNKKLLGVKVGALKALGVDQLLVEGIEFSIHNEIVQGIAAKLQANQKAVKDALGFTVQPSSPIAVIQDLLRATMGSALKRTGQRGSKDERYYTYQYVPGFISVDRETKEDQFDDRTTIFEAWLKRDNPQTVTEPASQVEAEPAKSESVREAYQNPNRSNKDFDMSAQGDMHTNSQEGGASDRPSEAVNVGDGFKVGDTVEFTLDKLPTAEKDRILQRYQQVCPRVLRHIGQKGIVKELIHSGERLGVSFNPSVNGGYPLVPLSPALCRHVQPSASVEPHYPPGSLVKWGSRLGEWLVVAVDGTTARVRAAAGWAGGMVWEAKLDDLRVAA